MDYFFIGTGLSFNLTPRLDFTPKLQYMVHLGSDIHADMGSGGHDHHHGHNHGGVTLTEHKGIDLEGHLLISLSMNYKIGKLWGRD